MGVEGRGGGLRAAPIIGRALNGVLSGSVRSSKNVVLEFCHVGGVWWVGLSVSLLDLL